MAQVHAIETKGNGIALQFEHPTIAGTTVGGWMNRADKIPIVSRTVLPPTACAHSSSACRQGPSDVPACLRWPAATSVRVLLLASTATGGRGPALIYEPAVRSRGHVMPQHRLPSASKLGCADAGCRWCSSGHQGCACMQQAPEPPVRDPAHSDASKADALRIYSMEEVERHDSRDSAWFVHRGQVRSGPCPLRCTPLLALPAAVARARSRRRMRFQLQHLASSWTRQQSLSRSGAHCGHGAQPGCCILPQRASMKLQTHSHLMPVQVYDATSFLKEHPGGGDSILLVAGTDATEEFDAIHSQKAKQQLLSFVVGRLANTKIGVLQRPKRCLPCWHSPGL